MPVILVVVVLRRSNRDRSLHRPGPARGSQGHPPMPKDALCPFHDRIQLHQLPLRRLIATLSGHSGQFVKVIAELCVALPSWRA